MNENFLVDFLSLSTDKDLKNSIKVKYKKKSLKSSLSLSLSFKNYLKLDKVKKIDQVQTVDGTIQIRISEVLNKYFDRSDSFLENTLTV